MKGLPEDEVIELGLTDIRLQCQERKGNGFLERGRGKNKGKEIANSWGFPDSQLGPIASSLERLKQSTGK